MAYNRKFTGSLYYKFENTAQILAMNVHIEKLP